MNRTRQDFQALVDRSINGTELRHLRSAVEKEILHCDILLAIQRHGYLNNVTFQGETCLRLVYGNNRLSEDLDFSGGTDFRLAEMDGMADVITDYLDRRYGLPVNVKSPREKPIRGGVTVYTWWISIDINPYRRDLPNQRIKIEIANVPAQTREARNLNCNYPVLLSSFSSIVVPAQTPQEIVADKIVALADTTSRPNVRYKDIWDIGFLSRILGHSDAFMNLVAQKVEDDGILDFDDMLANRIRSLPDVIEDTEFRNVMKSFLTPSLFNHTLLQTEYRAGLTRAVSDILEKVHNSLAT